MTTARRIPAIMASNSAREKKMTNNQELIQRIDDALDRLSRQDGDTVAGAIERLIAKRQLVTSGEYVIRDVTQECVTAMGGQIAYVIRAYWRG